MSKYVYAGLFVVALAGIAMIPACKGGGYGSDDGGSSACSSGGACGGGSACGACGAKKSGCGGACGACGSSACGAKKSACGGACGACGGACGACGGAAKVSPADARQAMRLFKQYQGWQQMNAKPILSKAHKRFSVVTYANALAKGSYTTGKGRFAPGASLAKQGYKKGQLKMVWLMQKRGPGYDSRNGDWWYATLTAGGKVLNSGKVESCLDCHESADHDYVYGIPK